MKESPHACARVPLTYDATNAECIGAIAYRTRNITPTSVRRSDARDGRNVAQHHSHPPPPPHTHTHTHTESLFLTVYLPRCQFSIYLSISISIYLFIC